MPQSGTTIRRMTDTGSATRTGFKAAITFAASHPYKEEGVNKLFVGIWAVELPSDLCLNRDRKS
jgi:hypothetical protein